MQMFNTLQKKMLRLWLIGDIIFFKAYFGCLLRIISRGTSWKATAAGPARGGSAVCPRAVVAEMVESDKIWHVY